MAKRDKKAEKGIESLKKEIEKHFEKLDKDIIENDELTARYHIKEIDRSLIDSLEKKTMLLKENSKESKESKKLLSFLRKKLEEYKKKISLE
jgi:hypothetical protein